MLKGLCTPNVRGTVNSAPFSHCGYLKGHKLTEVHTFTRRNYTSLGGTVLFKPQSAVSIQYAYNLRELGKRCRLISGGRLPRKCENS